MNDVLIQDLLILGRSGIAHSSVGEPCAPAYCLAALNTDLTTVFSHLPYKVFVSSAAHFTYKCAEFSFKSSLMNV
uniref:Uncharacterized protein n=1 Tax=Pristionchus pacificus TaxID=54126 RepID=A0A2A6CT84_PRIPA|eukprot:PDM81432.1 hypothetical protein PRIPAC_35308 [Pristionchus pacificus]